MKQKYIQKEFAFPPSKPCSTTLTHLASADGRSGNLVGSELVVDVGSVPRVGRLDMSGNRDTAEALGSTAGDLDLSAGDVELRRRARVVDGELFNADEVLASGDARWDGDIVGSRQVPCGLSTAERRTDFLDLEPWGRTVGRRGGVDLGHVAVWVC